MPFTKEQFSEVFEKYNRAIYPVQWALVAAALLAVLFALRRRPTSDRIAATLLSLLWLWSGVAYQIAHFSQVNKAAFAFGTLFIIQAALIAAAGVFRSRMEFRPRLDLNGIMGASLIVLALLVYPLLNSYFGHTFPRNPSFGTPCPTTIFTLGLLLWITPKLPRILIAVPFLWSIIGFTASLFLGIKEDVVLLVAGAIGTAIFLAEQKAPVSRRAESIQRLKGRHSPTLKGT